MFACFLCIFRGKCWSTLCLFVLLMRFISASIEVLNEQLNDDDDNDDDD